MCDTACAMLSRESLARYSGISNCASKDSRGCISRERKAHESKLFGSILLGTALGLPQGQVGFVPDTNPDSLLALPDLFSRVLLSFCPPSAGHPPPSPSLGTLFSPSKSALFCRAKGIAQTSSRGAVSGWTCPQSSGRKFLPEICV